MIASPESNGTLAEQGFRMPPEWHPHAATWMAWPHNLETWPDNLPEARDEFMKLLAAIAKDEPVVLIAGEKFADEMTNALINSSISNVWTNNIKTNDAWARDFAPTFIISEESNQLAAVDWHYNAWGGKYPPFDDDQRAAHKIAQNIPPHANPSNGCCYVKQDVCLEGGAIEVNENGILICTRSCALNPNRNPGTCETEMSEILKASLGARHTIWLTGSAITGDDTDGHVDQLARFTPNRTILYASSNQDRDPQRPALDQNLRDLERGLEELALDIPLIPLPLPHPIIVNGQRLPASYCNFYITNRSVIVPQFNDPKSDARALEIVATQFPGLETIGLPSINISVGLGSFHCLTQQQPVVIPNQIRKK